ncbi:MAG: hypothetical protein U9P10_10960 [Thermodesulfobacteriota bacterium]|nr:hypothetical protein [Thermodesulfobacteriota bacterium]
MEKETGLQYLETVIRYLASVLDELSLKEIKEMAEQAISKDTGGDDRRGGKFKKNEVKGILHILTKVVYTFWGTLLKKGAWLQKV